MSLPPPDPEKAASGASGACGHFVGNHTVLRTFGAKNPGLLTEDETNRLRIEVG